MGVFRVRMRVYNPGERDRSREIEMVVDSGATYPVIPRTLASELGMEPSATRTFTLADGSTIVREVAEAGFAHDGRTTACLVVLGEESDVPLLGAHALEGLGYEVDPIAKVLRSTTQYLLGAAASAVRC